MALLKPIRLKIAVRKSPAAVWKAWTDPRQLVRWFVHKARVVPGKGGVFEIGWGKDVALPYAITEWKPGKAIAFAWGDGTASRITCTKRGAETVVEVVTMGYRDDLQGVEAWAFTRQAWAYYLLNLKSFLERGWDFRDKNPRRPSRDGWVNFSD